MSISKKVVSFVIASVLLFSIAGWAAPRIEPYPSDYDETTDVALREQHEKARPKLSTHVARMADYDTIFLGYPNWWGTHSGILAGTDCSSLRTFSLSWDCMSAQLTIP
jgi:hypothetical protein